MGSRRAKRSAYLVAGLLLPFLGTTANAGQVALISFTDGTPYVFSRGGDKVIGWQFTMKEDANVTELGFYDTTPETPLDQPHEVGIWSESGALIGKATVLRDSPIVRGFRFEPVESFRLTANETYRIAAYIDADNTDPFISYATDVITSPEVEFNQAARSAEEGTGFTFPDEVTKTRIGRFGPNFQYVLPGARLDGRIAVTSFEGGVRLSDLGSGGPYFSGFSSSNSHVPIFGLGGSSGGGGPGGTVGGALGTPPPTGAEGTGVIYQDPFPGGGSNDSGIIPPVETPPGPVEDFPPVDPPRFDAPIPDLPIGSVALPEPTTLIHLGIGFLILIAIGIRSAMRRRPAEAFGLIRLTLPIEVRRTR